MSMAGERGKARIDYCKLTESQKVKNGVIPAKAGIQSFQTIVDSCLRRNDN